LYADRRVFVVLTPGQVAQNIKMFIVITSFNKILSYMRKIKGFDPGERVLV